MIVQLNKTSIIIIIIIMIMGIMKEKKYSLNCSDFWSVLLCQIHFNQTEITFFLVSRWILIMIIIIIAIMKIVIIRAVESKSSSMTLGFPGIIKLIFWKQNGKNRFKNPWSFDLERETVSIMTRFLDEKQFKFNDSKRESINLLIEDRFIGNMKDRNMQSIEQ